MNELFHLWNSIFGDDPGYGPTMPSAYYLPPKLAYSGADQSTSVPDTPLIPSLIPLPPQNQGAARVPLSVSAPPDQAVMPPPAFHLTPEQEAGIRNSAREQAIARGAGHIILGLGTEAALEAIGVPKPIARVVGAGMDIHDVLEAIDRYRNAPGQAVYKNMNDTLNQAYTSPNMPGFRSLFPFP